VGSRIKNCKSFNELEILPNAAIGLSDNGTIIFLTVSYDESSLSKYCTNIKHLSKEEFIIPGFIDTHAHAPQFYFAGLGTDLPLLQWLEKYTFPCESKFADPKLATSVYNSVIQRILKNGTTSIALFGTIHLEACKILTDVAERIGCRAFIGKVNMDQNSPPFYIEKTDDSIKETRLFVEYVLAKNQPDKLVPVITPRFAPTCSMKLMKSLGDIAREFNIPIQSHVAENKNECQWVLSLFPDCKSYTEVYEKAGLLTDKTIMAHCIYLSKPEIELMKKYQVGVSHCANSNFTLTSGAMPIRTYLEHGMKISLGTDVAGGWSPSMLDAIRQTIICSKVNGIINKMEQISVTEAFYLATMGGAQVLGIDRIVGNFEIGKQFDAQIISIKPNNIDFYGHETMEEIFAKFIYLGDDRNVKEVYVKGKKVYENYQQAVTAPSSPVTKELSIHEKNEIVVEKFADLNIKGDTEISSGK